MTSFGDQNGMFPLGGELVIFGDDGPAIGEDFEVAFAGIDHGFDGEDHARFDNVAGSYFSIVKNLRVFVNIDTNTMPTKFTND